jgi:hypothetical protein
MRYLKRCIEFLEEQMTVQKSQWQKESHAKELLRELKEDHPDWTTDELFREWWHLVQSDESLKEEVLNLTIENVLQDLKSSPHS